MLSKSYVKSKNICKVTFKIPNEELPEELDVKTAAIVADFNDWSMIANPMKRTKGGDFQATIELEPNKRYEYRYLLNDVEWYNDWAADEYSANRLVNADNCVVSLENMAADKSKATEKNKAAEKSKAVDNLTKISGIGPKVAALLKAEGITSFATLATTPVDTLQGILDKAGKRYQIIVPTTWPDQARSLSEGKG